MVICRQIRLAAALPLSNGLTAIAIISQGRFGLAQGFRMLTISKWQRCAVHLIEVFVTCQLWGTCLLPILLHGRRIHVGASKISRIHKRGLQLVMFAIRMCIGFGEHWVARRIRSLRMKVFMAEILIATILIRQQAESLTTVESLFAQETRLRHHHLRLRGHHVAQDRRRVAIQTQRQRRYAQVVKHVKIVAVVVLASARLALLLLRLLHLLLLQRVTFAPVSIRSTATATSCQMDT